MKGTFGLIFFLLLGFQGFSQVKMEKAEGGFLFTEDGKNVLFYQSSPKNISGQFERCNYIHPLWGLKGKILTEDFPADHLHQGGVFWAWHQIWIGDKRIGDGWELKNFEQWINEIEFAPNSTGAAVLKTEVLWRSENWIRLGQKIPFLKENNTITINPKKGNYRKIDFKIELLALEENLKIGGSEDEKGYGGFSVRMKLPDDVSFYGRDGVIVPELTQVESEGYVNVTGSVGSKNSKGGIVIVDNPENSGFPQKWILREKEGIQNVVFPGNKNIPLSTTEPLILKYSLIIYSGRMNDRKVQKILD